MNTEEWRGIEGHPSYEVSNFGRVRSLDRIDLIGHRQHGRIRKLALDSSGYPHITLRTDGKITTRKVHRLVAQAFVQNTEGKPEVNHKNGCKTDNCDSNLEWVTGLENNRHARQVLNKYLGGPRKAVIATKAGEQLRFESTSAARHAGFDPSHISKCCRGVLNKHGGYTWSYV